MQLRAVFLREGHVGQHVVLGVVHDGRELRSLGPDLVGDGTPRALAASAVSSAKAVAMKADTTRRPPFPAWARALRRKSTRHRCHVA
jgi:hypothetical protein